MMKRNLMKFIEVYQFKLESLWNGDVRMLDANKGDQYNKSWRMKTIFESCTDPQDNTSIYGGCLRQYIVFGLCLLITGWAAYSCYRTWRAERKLSLQYLPLVINTLTSFILIYFYIQIQPFNTAIYLFIVEVYTYFILCFGLIVIVVKQSPEHARKVKRLYLILVFVSLAALIALVAMLVVEVWLKGIGCKADQGPATIVMIFLEIPIVVLTCYYGRKFKHILTHQSQSHHTAGESPTFVTKHLLEQEDRYVLLKKLQANLAMIALIVSLCLHIVDIVLYYGVDGQSICNDKDELTIKDGTALAIRWIQNFAELFPHFMIPLIFWYLPAKMATQYSTLYISQHSNDSSNKHSHRTPDKKELPKLQMGDHQESQFFQGMHNEDNVRQKLIPKSPQRTSSI